MNKFQYAEKINANTKLSFANKAIINQIISFQLNNQKFHGTDEYLASTWGVSTRTIQRQIAELKKLNLIQVELDKKKHSTGDKTWYNKRYITVDLTNLSNFLQNNTSVVDSKPILSDLNYDITEVESIIIEEEIKPQMESIEVVPTDEPIEVITDDSDEFDYDDEQQEAWFNQMAGIKNIKEIKEDIALSNDEPIKKTFKRLPVENQTEIRNFLMKLLLNGQIKNEHKNKVFGYDRLTITEQFEIYEDYLEYVK